MKTEVRLYSVGILARAQMAWSMFFNFFRVILFGEVKISFHRLDDGGKDGRPTGRD